MKRRDVLKLAPIAFITGCTSWLKPTEEGGMDPALLAYMVETAGMAIGLGVADMDPGVDAALRNIYFIAAEGKLDVMSINNLIQPMISGEDLVAQLLANRLLGLVDLFGGQLVGNQVAALGELDPKLMAALSRGYVSGYDMKKRERARRAFA